MSQSMPPTIGIQPQPKKSNSTIIVIAIVAGILLMLLVCGGVLAALLLPAISKARSTAQEMVTQVRLQELSMGLEAYLSEHQDIAPVATDWNAALQPYLSQMGNPVTGRAFAMNAALSGVDVSTLKNPGQTVVFFEVPDDGPHFGGAELLPAEPWSDRGHLMRMADGSIVNIPPQQVPVLIWKP